MELAPPAVRSLRPSVYAEYADPLTPFVTGAIHETPTEGTMIDPNVILLFFLFGFCLLYVFFVVFDAVQRRRSDGSIPSAETTERRIDSET